MTPTVAASKPISFMNSFSTGTQSMKPWSATATCSGSSRRRTVASTERLTVVSTMTLQSHDRPRRYAPGGGHLAGRISRVASRNAASRASRASSVSSTSAGDDPKVAIVCRDLVDVGGAAVATGEVVGDRVLGLVVERALEVVR